MDQAAALETLKLTRALQAARRCAPLYFFEPAPRVRRLLLSRARIRVLSGANRCGKTHGLVAEALSAALGYRPWVLRKEGLPIPDPLHVRPDLLPPDALVTDRAGVRLPIPNRSMLVTGLPARLGIGETIVPKLRELGGPLVRHIYKEAGGIPSRVVLANGSEIVFASAAQRDIAFESTAFHAYFVDEPIPRRAWGGIRRGTIDHGARILIAATPWGQNAAWMVNDIYRAGEADVAYVGMRDNPYLDPTEIDAFENDPSIPPSEKMARLYGLPGAIADSIYGDLFDENVHVIDPFMVPNDWLKICSIDPHAARPWAILWAALAPDGTLYVIDEHPDGGNFHLLRSSTNTIGDYVAIIRNREGARPADIRVIDPNAGPARQRAHGVVFRSTVHVLAEAGLPCHYHINDRLDVGEAAVRRLLSYNKRAELSDLNRPKLFVFRGCKNTANALQFYSSAQDSSGYPSEQRRDETFKDFADALRYAVLAAEAIPAGASLNEIQPYNEGGSYGSDLER